MSGQWSNNVLSYNHSQEMNVSWKLYRREDRKWASLQPDGTFDGMISNLRKGEADIIAASLTNRADRQKAVDFLVGGYMYRLRSFLNLKLVLRSRSA